MSIRGLCLVSVIGVVGGLASVEAQAQATRCRTSNCFDENDVREFEVLGDDTMVAYVGRQRCPFLLRVDPLYCDLRFLPDVSFVKTRSRSDLFRATRVCTHEMGVGLDTLGFASRDPNHDGTNPIPGTDPAGGAVFGRDLPCRLTEFRPMSDDEIIELYVEEGLVAPPPPIGSGQISRAGDQDAEEAERADADDEAESAE
jgi:hypothetical protein